jgi:iron complex outermembrane recepter protein
MRPRASRAIVALVCAVAVFLGAPANGRSEEPRSSRLEEIVVTAQKREQQLQEVPISMTVLTDDFVLDAGLEDFSAIMQYAPNISITTITDTRNTALRIRGIGADQSNAGIDPSVGVFIDGIYQGRTALAATADLIDIERIEVLRGPQGTLFGKNTAAGAFNIITNKPSFAAPELFVETTFANYNEKTLRGMVNLPVLDDRIATRLTGYVSRRDGFDENLSGLDRNDADRNGLRWHTLLAPRDDLELRVTLEYATSQSRCCVADIITYDGPPSLDVTFAPFVSPDGSTIGSLAETTGRPLPAVDPFDRVVDANEDTVDSTRVWGISTDLDYELGEHGLKWILGYREFTSFSVLDGDFTGYDAVFLDTDEDFNQWSSELQLISPTGERFDYVAGAYFYTQRDRTLGELGIAPEWIAASPVLGIPLGNTAEDGIAYNRDTNIHETFSYALFGQGSYHFTDRWTLTVGLRGTYEEKSRKGSQIATLKVDTGPFGPDRFPDQDLSVFDLSPLGVLQYRPTDDAMTFAKIARGFKSGGFNQQRTTGGDGEAFDDEKATDFELGARSTWLDGLLTLNATGFYVLYDDFQAQSFDGTGFTVTNAGSLTSYGIEADALVVPHPDVVVGGGLGWNVAEYDSFDRSPCTAQQSFDARVATGNIYQRADCVQDLGGRRLDNAPRWTTNVFAQIERQLAGLELFGEPLFGRFRVEYNYRDFIYLSQDLDANLTEGPVHLMNLRAGVFADGGHWDLTLWTTNAIDQEYQAFGIDVPIVSGFAGLNGPPRQFGATLRLFF